MFEVNTHFKESFVVEQQNYLKPKQFLERHIRPKVRKQIYCMKLNKCGFTKGRVHPGQNNGYPTWLVYHSAPTDPTTVPNQPKFRPKAKIVDYEECFESVSQQRPEVKEEISAFGLTHAKHARKLYRSRASDVGKNESLYCTIPQYCQPMGHDRRLFLSREKKVVQAPRNGGCVLYEPPRSRKAVRDNPIKRATPSSIIFEPHGPIFKRAIISPRPNAQESEVQGTSMGLGFNEFIIRRRDRGSLKFLESETNKRMGTTAFQILCER